MTIKAGGPIYFFAQDESQYKRRPRKSLSLVHALEEAQDEGAECVAIDTIAPPTSSPSRPVTVEKDHLGSRPGSKESTQNQTLVSRLEDDLRVFTEGTEPSLHKFLPLLKQAILTFDLIEPVPTEKPSVHARYLALKAQSGETLDELSGLLEEMFKENRRVPTIPAEIRSVFTANYNTLVSDTVVEYRVWLKGAPPNLQGQSGTAKLNSQVSELTQSIDGSARSGSKSRYSRRQRGGMWSGADTDGGTSSRSNDGQTARRESARRRNIVSDQSDIIEDLYLENHSEFGSRMGRGGEKSGKRRELEALYEPHGHNPTINFSLVNPNCAAKGWIINPRDGELKDRSLVKYLLERLQKCRFSRVTEEKRVAQLRFPYLIKLYPEFETDLYRPKRALSWANRHKIGLITEVPHEPSSQLIYAFPDGSTTIYYPDGNICAVVTSCQQGKEQDLTRTINVFQQHQQNNIIASFSPSGVGSVWYDGGKPAFLSTVLGGCIYSTSGMPSKSWSWNNVDTEDFLLPITDYLTLYFNNSGEVNLHLQLGEECVFVNVKSSRAPTEEAPPTGLTLVSGLSFRSNTAQAILNAPKTRGRRKMRQKRVSSTRVTDDSETEELHYPHKHSLADQVDRYLITNTKRIVKSVEELLLHFRQELSLGRLRSADVRATDSEITLLQLPEGYKTVSGGKCKKKSCISLGLNVPPYLVCPERGVKKRGWKVRGSSAVSGNGLRSPRKRACNTCPISLRLFTNTGQEAPCKCDWKTVPIVCDVEFDQLVSESRSPPLVVVSVFSSRHPEATPYDPMVEEIYYGMNYRPVTVEKDHLGSSRPGSKESTQNQNLVSRLEDDLRVFTEGTEPSLHKFLPLLKQAILTFDLIEPVPTEKPSVHARYLALKAQSGETLDELSGLLEEMFKENRRVPTIPAEIRSVFTANYNTLVSDTVVEYRVWLKGAPPNLQGQSGTAKLNSQVSELTQSIDGSARSGSKSRYSRRQRGGMWSGADTDGGTSSRSNDGQTARRESARRRNIVSDQSDIIEDLYLENHSEFGSRMGRGGEKSGKRRELEALYEPHGHNPTINFSLVNPNCAAKGWIINPREGELKDRSLVKYLLERLQKCRFSRVTEEKRVAQLRFPYLIKLYPEFETDLYRPKRALSWANRHKIGLITEVPHEPSSQLIYAFPDGSTTIYYPDGNICAVVTSCQQGKEQDLTRTINVFQQHQQNNIIASFSPSGVGSVWYDGGKPAFLSTVLGGCIYSTSGMPSKSWSWNNVDTEDFLLPITDYLTLYFNNSGEVNLHLQLGEECVFVNVKSSRAPTEEAPPTGLTLVSGLSFRSNTAQAILNAPKTRGRRKMRQKRVSSTRVTDDSETEELHYPHKHSLADQVDRYLITNTKKIVKSVEELLLHFRQELSLGRLRSADVRATDSEITLSQLPEGYKTVSKVYSDPVQCSVFSLICIRREVQKEELYLSGSERSTLPSVPRERGKEERVEGKCDWKTVPIVCDVEFDQLVSESRCPPLVVVSVFSSRHPEATPYDPMVEEIYYGMNYR
eukprot:sb/3460832/